MTDITIPPKALRAARAASMNARGDGEDPVRAACLAMLKAWPGIEVRQMYSVWSGKHGIILPLPTENTND